jgi:hypothetical protein
MKDLPAFLKKARQELEGALESAKASIHEFKDSDGFREFVEFWRGNQHESPGEWLLQQIDEHCVIEREGWAPERAERVLKALQRGRPPEDCLEVVVYWASLVTAFTLPGRYIFFSRPLIDRCPDDETVAFIVAHELAHHDLGHLDDPEWAKGLTRIPGRELLTTATKVLDRATHGPEWECDADVHALKLCIAAGYDPHKCLNAFHVLETHVMDVGRSDLVCGSDPDLDPELNRNMNVFQKSLGWIATRMTGYLPIKDRVSKCQEFLERSAARGA